MNILADEADLREILHIVADDVVDVAHGHLRGEDVSSGVHVPAEVEFLLEFVVVDRRVFREVEYIGVVEELLEVMKEITVREYLLVALFSAARHGHEEEFRLGLHGLEALDDFRVPAAEGVGVLFGVFGVYVFNRADRHFSAVEVVYAEGDYVRLAELVGVPEVVRVGEGLHVFDGCHAAAGEVDDFAAGGAGDVLTP